MVYPVASLWINHQVIWEGQCRLRDEKVGTSVVYVNAAQPEALSAIRGKAAANCRPEFDQQGSHSILVLVFTGVIVVSNHPTSTTSPVIRPQAASAKRLEGVNATDGTRRLSKRVWAICSLIYVGRNVFSAITTLRCLESANKCLSEEFNEHNNHANREYLLDKCLSQLLYNSNSDQPISF